MLSDARGTMNDFKGNTKLKAALDEEVRQKLGERRTGTRGSGSNLSELGTDEDTESRRKQENFADMKQAVREVLQELGIVSQEAPGAGDIAEDIRSGEKPDTVHPSSNGLDADTESGYDYSTREAAEANYSTVLEAMRNVLEDTEIRESFYETDENTLLGERGDSLLSELSDADYETLQKIFVAETGSDIPASKAEKELYAYAVRIAGLTERKRVKAAGHWYIIEEVTPEAYTANMIRSRNATKAMGADIQ